VLSFNNWRIKLRIALPPGKLHGLPEQPIENRSLSGMVTGDFIRIFEQYLNNHFLQSSSEGINCKRTFCDDLMRRPVASQHFLEDLFGGVLVDFALLVQFDHSARAVGEIVSSSID
jgi:hypothetical protein